MRSEGVALGVLPPEPVQVPGDAPRIRQGGARAAAEAPMTMTPCYVGLDVAKAHLDLATSPATAAMRFTA